jgi:Ca-activated chloride channel family protein
MNYEEWEQSVPQEIRQDSLQPQTTPIQTKLSQRKHPSMYSKTSLLPKAFSRHTTPAALRLTLYVLRFTFYALRFTLYVSLLSSCAPGVVQHNNTGNEHFAEEAFDEAIAEYRQAQVDAPDQAEPYYNAANVYNRQSQLDAALAQAQQALKSADPDLAAQTWYNLGNAYFDAQQWPQAIAAYQEALRLDPNDLDAKHNLELALQKQEQQEQQQDQEQQDQQDQQDGQEQDNQESERNEQPQTGAATPTPAGQPETTPEQDQATPQPSGQAQQDAEMTPEQALQLLQALAANSETLQERLQEIFRVPGPPPAEDW